VTIRGNRHPVSAMTMTLSTVEVKELKSTRPSSSKRDLCSKIVQVCFFSSQIGPMTFSNEIEKQHMQQLIAIQTFRQINPAWTPTNLINI
jgi:hypothetical protein